MLIKKIHVVLCTLLFGGLSPVYADIDINLVDTSGDKVHLAYVPIQVKNTQNYPQTIKSFEALVYGGDAQKYIKACDTPYCGQQPTSNEQMTRCDVGVTIPAKGFCYVWFSAKTNGETWPFHKDGFIVGADIAVDVTTREDETGSAEFKAAVDYSLFAGTSDKIYKYNGGNSWETIGTVSGNSPQVSTMALFKGDLYIGGNFTGVSGGTSASNFMKWDGVKFISPSGIDNGVVKSLNVSHDNTTINLGGTFTSRGSNPNDYATYWSGSAFMRGSGSAKEAIYGISDDILTTNLGVAYKKGLIVNTGGLLVNADVDRSAMPVNATRISAITKLSDSARFCVGGSAGSGTGIALECYMHQLGSSKLSYIAHQNFSGANYCLGKPNSFPSINSLDANESMGIAIAGGCMFKKDTSGGTKSPVFNIAYSFQNEIQSGSANKTWKAFDDGVNLDVYALASSGPYEFVGGAFDHQCTPSEGGGCKLGSIMQHIGYFKMRGTTPVKPVWNADDSKKLPGLPDTVYSLVTASSITLTKID